MLAVFGSKWQFLMCYYGRVQRSDEGDLVWSLFCSGAGKLINGIPPFSIPPSVMAEGFMQNARSANGNLRRKNRARLRAIGAECGICHGRLGPIHYDEPSDSRHPLSFVIDEIKPVSRWREFGYASARAAAEDWSNLQAAHYCCNAAKSNHVDGDQIKRRVSTVSVADGQW